MSKILQHVDVVEAYVGAIREARKSGAPTGSVISVDVIRSGWNTSGTKYYPRAVLERDVPRVYGKGTHMHLDHPSTSEREERPERSLGTFAAVFLEDPYPVEEADGRVVMRTTARVFSDSQAYLAERKDAIGVSINGAGEGDWGEAEGRTGVILEALTHGQSVDFVTKPGAGGRIVALLESEVPTAEAATVGAWLESQLHSQFTVMADDMYGTGGLTRAERIAVSNAIGDGLAAFVAAVEAKAPQLYERARWDEPPSDNTVRVRESTTGRTAAGSIKAVEAADPSMKENSMPEITTAEAYELAQYRVAEGARGLLDTALAESELPPPAQVKVRERFGPTSLPLVESDRSLDVPALNASIAQAVEDERTYVGQILESAGVGRVASIPAADGAGSGLPASWGAPRQVPTAEADVRTTEALVQTFIEGGMTEAAARAAAKGR